MSELGHDLARTLDDMLAERSSIGRQLEALNLQRVDGALVGALDDLGVGLAGVTEADGGLDLGLSDLALLSWVGGRRLMPTFTRLQVTLLTPILADRLNGMSPRTWAIGFPSLGSVQAKTQDVWSGGETRRALVVDETGALVIDLDDAGACLIDDPGIDGGQGRANLRFDPTAGERLEVPNHPWLVQRARLMVVAELLGLVDRVTDVAVGYAKQRMQFGRTISSFQSIQHTLAEMEASRELIRAGVSRVVASTSLEPRHTTSLAASSVALARKVVEDAIQIHGGIGFTWEYGLHLYYRRCLALEEQLGGVVRLNETLGRMIERGDS